MFLTLQPSNQAVEAPHQLVQCLLSVADILVCLLAIDAVIQVDVQERLTQLNAVDIVSVGSCSQFLGFQLA